MRRLNFLRTAPLVFALVTAVCSLNVCFAQEIKKPNVAGVFYPDDTDVLSRKIDVFLDESQPEQIDGQIFALISPHAGYDFSGKVAAKGFKLIKAKTYKTVVVIGASHYYGFKGISVYPSGKFLTPLGALEIDNSFTDALLNKDADVFFDAKAFQKEHSVEVQLPFLQKTLSEFKIVPIVMGDCSFQTCEKFAKLLQSAIGLSKDVLVVVSTDMYHGYDYDEAEIIDGLTLSYLKNMDAKGLYEGLREGNLQLCGGLSVVSTMLLAKGLGHDKLKVLEYTNSAEVTGRKIKGSWTVGYSSSVIDQPKGEKKMLLNKEQRKKLLEIARKSIETYLKTGERLKITETDPVLKKEMGAFVTLHEHGELRGCIGNMVGTQALYLTVRDMAVEAATGDPRFEPMKLPELKNVEIEISALSPMEKVDSADKIELGVHGVMVRRGFNSGVFLPQVATETGWSKEEFLSYLCSHKAGLAPLAWKDKATELYIFTAEVFSEKEY